MPNWLRNWFENQKQTRAFHPSWILLGVVATVIVAALVWIPAALFLKAESPRAPAAQGSPAPEKEAPQTAAVPPTVRQPPLPASADLSTLPGDASSPDADDVKSGGAAK